MAATDVWGRSRPQFSKGRGNAPELRRNYAVVFTGSENPISMGRDWANGSDDTGGVFSNCAITNAIAHGKHNGVQYADPTAILKGIWVPNMEVEGWFTGVGTQGAACGGEVEVRARSFFTKDKCFGYEFLRTTTGVGGGENSELVRWNGALADFTSLVSFGASTPTAVNGDRTKIKVVGSTITVTLLAADGTVLATDSAVDATFLQGNPGIGLYIGSNCLTQLADEHLFGFTRFEVRGL